MNERKLDKGGAAIPSELYTAEGSESAKRAKTDQAAPDPADAKAKLDELLKESDAADEQRSK